MTFFRGYNLLVVVAVALMTLGLIELRRERLARATKAFATGWWIALAGHVLLAAGSIPAVIFGDRQRDFVMAAQDVGFLGAVVAALGGLVFGASALRRRSLPRAPAVLFAAALPVGFVGIMVLDLLGAPEDVLGLPLTVLYGGAMIALAIAWRREGRDARSVVSDGIVGGAGG